MMHSGIGSPLIADVALGGALLLVLIVAFALVLFVLVTGSRRGPHHP